MNLPFLMFDLYKRSATISGDGSTTFRLEGLGVNEHFHSIHGAYSESMHIFIQAGLQSLLYRKRINILEVGFGTGLNALLTLIHQGEREIHYEGIEAYPLNRDEVSALNYDKQIDKKWSETFYKMHDLPSGEKFEIYPNFYYQKKTIKIEEAHFPDNYFDLVYFDAFSPALQPELWGEEIFEKLYAAMQFSSILVTYCAKGSVKRAMKASGFTVEGLPGPVGKREITRCRKKECEE